MNYPRSLASNHESMLIKCRFAESDGDVEVTPAPVKTFARMKEKVDKKQ